MSPGNNVMTSDLTELLSGALQSDVGHKTLILNYYYVKRVATR